MTGYLPAAMKGCSIRHLPKDLSMLLKSRVDINTLSDCVTEVIKNSRSTLPHDGMYLIECRHRCKLYANIYHTRHQASFILCSRQWPRNYWKGSRFYWWTRLHLQVPGWSQGINKNVWLQRAVSFQHCLAINSAYIFSTWKSWKHTFDSSELWGAWPSLSIHTAINSSWYNRDVQRAFQ